MTAAATTSVLGLTAALIWGAADFSGGIAAKYLRVYWLLVLSHASSLAVLLVLTVLMHQARPDAYILGWGLLSGLAGGIALLTFFACVIHFTRVKRFILLGLIIIMVQIVFWSQRAWNRSIKNLRKQIADME